MFKKIRYDFRLLKFKNIKLIFKYNTQINDFKSKINLSTKLLNSVIFF